MVPRMITVEGLVLVEEIILGHEPAIYITVSEIDGILPLRVGIRELLPRMST